LLLLLLPFVCMQMIQQVLNPEETALLLASRNPPLMVLAAVGQLLAVSEMRIESKTHMDESVRQLQARTDSVTRRFVCCASCRECDLFNSCLMEVCCRRGHCQELCKHVSFAPSLVLCLCIEHGFRGCMCAAGWSC